MDHLYSKAMVRIREDKKNGVENQDLFDLTGEIIEVWKEWGGLTHRLQ